MYCHELIKFIRKHTSGEDWNNDEFSISKAYICSLFSSLAYAEIPQWEIGEGRRFKLIPSALYQQIYKIGSAFSIIDTLRENGILREYRMEAFHIIEEGEFIYTALLMNNILFIAVRGSQNAYDWSTNFNIKKKEGFHLGFSKEVDKNCSELLEKIADISNENTKIYFTGHSLGGAVAAILQIKWPEIVKKSSHKLPDTSIVYTFGAPMFSGIGHNKRTYINQFHLISQKDIVPRLPSLLMGYIKNRKTILIPDIFSKNKKYRRIKGNHDVENYRSNISKYLGLPDRIEELTENVIKLLDRAKRKSDKEKKQWAKKLQVIKKIRNALHKNFLRKRG